MFDKEKTNKQSLKNISKNNINQYHYYNIDSHNNSNTYKKETIIIDEATASKDNYIDLSLDTISNEERFIKCKTIDAHNQYKPVIKRREQETKQHAENEIVTVGAYVVMNQEQCNNKVSNDIEPSSYKETKSITYETNANNNRYAEFGSESIFKVESYIQSSKVDENNQDNTIFQRKKEELRKMKTRLFLTLEDMN